MHKSIFAQIVFYLLLMSSSSFAYNTNDEIFIDPITKENQIGGHEQITEWNVKLAAKEDIPVLFQSVNLKNGAHDEDLGARALRHFYSPALLGNGKGLFNAFPSAKTEAKSWYEKALKNKSFYELGHALHLLQDMASPSHIKNASHRYHFKNKVGYEWWVTKNWDSAILPILETLEKIDPTFRLIRGGNIDGYMEGMANSTYSGGYNYDEDFIHDESKQPEKYSYFNVVGPADSAYNASILIPSIVRLGAGLLKTFCIDGGCGPRPDDKNKHTQGNPDDNFDVSSRLIELEELDVTKQAWKDLYGRTSIKKGYNGLFLEKTATEAYAKLAITTTEADYNAAAQQFQTVLNRVQKEAKHSFEDTYYASADVALLSDAFVDNAAELLLKRLKEPIREVKETFAPTVLLKNQPVLLIPSGALTGFNDSPMLKASLDEYVKQGGTLIVLSQKHGYDYASIPTPDGKPITGYGWEEDQNCFADSVAIESWHQLLSGQSRSTPTLNVDGYFTGYPANSTVLLRRTANGQPAMLMYEHGAGRVIVTSMYSDWAYGHGQTSQEEISLIRDMLSWAKKPAALPEIKQGEPISVPVTLTNSTSTAAASIKLQIWNPDRSTLLLEQIAGTSIPAGQSAINTVTWQAPSNATLGIYHIDYILLDAAGNIIQPQAETDSGRFVVSNPPQTGTVKKDIWLTITSPNQQVFFGEPFAYAFHIFNNTATTRNLTLRTILPHTGRTREYQVTATANGETVISGTDLFIDWNFFETLQARLYDENNVEIGSYMLTFKAIFPQVTVTTAPAKPLYTRGETVNISVNLGNSQDLAATVKLVVTVTDPSNSISFTNTADVLLPASGQDSRSFTFLLPQTAQGGVYTVSSEVLEAGGKKVGGDSTAFEIPLRLVAVTPGFPAGWQAGVNQLSFNVSNQGVMSVTTGLLGALLTDPEGAAIASASQPFTLNAGQTKNLDLSLVIPPLKFGVYTLAYNQGDATGPGKNSLVSLTNSVAITASFDKPSYRIRETANLALTLSNSGKFNLTGLSVGIAVPDAGYSDTETVNLAANQSMLLNKLFSLPETVAAGQHAVIVTLTLPSGSVITKSLTITVPESSLALSISQSAITAGSNVTVQLVNSGGRDTSAEHRLSLYDAKAVQLAEQSATVAVRAGETLALNLPIALGAADGVYSLAANYRDTVTGRLAMEQKLLAVSGVKGALTLQSDKQAYLTSEVITALSNITNNGTSLQDSKLHLQVATAVGSQKQKTWTSKDDFQQGVRDGVDTFGVNDWFILAEDFTGDALDKERWADNNYGVNSQKAGNGTLIQTAGPGAGFVSFMGNSYPLIEGDLDIQIDYNFVNLTADGESWAILSLVTPSQEFRVERLKSSPYGLNVYDSYYWDGSSWRHSPYYGTADTSGKLRLTKTGTVATAFCWENGAWKQLLSLNIWDGPSNFGVWTTNNYYNNHVEVNWKNFKVNSGQIVTKNETVDSVRLLRVTDNFDDGVLNDDRWLVRGSGSVATSETNGSLVMAGTQGGVQSYANAAGRFPLEGDFDLSIDWKTPDAPASGEWGSILQLSEMYQNISPDNSLVGNALQIKRAYVNGLGHVYQTGHYNGSSWDGWSNPVATGDAAGRFRIKRAGSIITAWYWNNSLNRWEWNGDTAGYTWSSVWITPTYIQIGTVNNVSGSPAAETRWNNFKVGGTAYANKGTIRLKQDAGQTSNWQTLSWNATQPIGTFVKLRTRTAETDSGLASASWSDYLTASGLAITSPKGRWIEVEAALSTTDTAVTPLLNDVTVTYGSSSGDILWQNDVPVNLAQGAISDLSSSIGTIGTPGKYYLQGTLTSSTGQTISSAEYPFFVAQGNTLLSFTSDKRIYKRGETVTVSGEVKNLATVEAANLALELSGKPAGGTQQPLYSATFALPAGGSRPFSFTTTAGADGIYSLSSNVTQNAAVLAQISDQYEVASPKVAVAITAPDIAGNDPFTTSIELKNSGKADATVSISKSFDSQPETVTISAGQTRLIQYSRQISADTTDTFTFTGDLTQAITKTVKYGPAAALAVTPQALYPEGKVSLPITVTNSGLIDSQFTVNYQLSQGATSVSQQSKSYFLTKGTSSSDSLSYDLPEGNYQLVATGQRPAASAAASFQVRKETKAELTLSVGAQSAGFLPATVTVTNLGYLPIEGSVRLSLIANDGTTAWTAVKEVILPQALLPAPHSLVFSLNLASLKPGSYTIKAELLDAGNRQLASQSAPFNLLGPAIAISQLPQDRTVPSGGSSKFIFKVKNSGNQDGKFDLSFKAEDLIDVTRSEWLKPGEEKELAFVLQAAGDLDEKDYFATYILKSGSMNSEQGTVKYHLQGLNLAVTANLDRQAYNDGDIASFTLSVTQKDAGAAPNLFARVNYNGYNEKQSFTLNGSQTLVFNVPLTQITGEKLFYGIYTESGRSIHLNTIYVRKADAALAIAADKQVYNPGETVVVAISGSASGDLTLTGPGEFATSFTYSGSDTKSFVLPQAMTAGTYTIKAQLKTPDSRLLTASHPFDVTGIQVKVKEALLDRAKYAAIDTMRLNLTIESNRDIPAIVKTWIVDPAGTYTEAENGAAALTAAAPLMTTIDSQFSTTSLGIHKLVYGIYQGDLLLASGAKAFDIGEAVLLGLATDKTDYPEVTMPVSVKVDLYGTTAAGIELLLDGQSVNSDSITLSGTSLYTFVIPAASLTPGLHNLKAVLSSGGLTSSRESRFTFGSTLPDLTARIVALPVSGSKMKLSVTVSNQGKTAAGESRAALFDGDPAKGGQQLAILIVPALAAGSSATLPFEWNILGQSGQHVLYAQADSDNSVIEFIEMNNTALTAVSLPSMTLSVTAGKSAYGANEAAALTVDITNLTADLPLENSTLKLRLTSPAGLAIDLPERNIGIIPPASAMSFAEIWHSGITAPADITVTARMVSGVAELASATGSFAITPTVSLTGSIAPVVAEIPQESSLEALYNVSNSGNVPIDGKLQVIIRDPQNGTSKYTQEIPLQLPVGGSKAGAFALPLTGLEIKGYDLLLGFISASSDISVARSRFTIKDTIPPVLTVSTLSDGSYTNQETLNVSGTVHDNSGSAQVEINGASVTVAADGSFSQVLLLGKPDNSVEVKAIDMAGNRVVDSRTIHFDKTAPNLTTDSPADNSKTDVSPIEVKGSVDETSTVTVKLNGVIQPAIMDNNRFSVSITLEPRWNTIEITATDLAGNTGSQKRSVLFDDQKPSLSITQPDQDIRTNKSSLTISGKASDPYSAVGVTVAIDGAVLTPPVVNDIFSQIVTFRDEKLYPITITASNEVGTQTTAQRNIIFDKTPPNLTIDPVVTPTNASGQAVSGTREDGALLVVICATATVGVVEYPTVTTWRAAVSGLSLGENRLQAETVDLAGNRTIATATILYVPKAPEVTVSAIPNQLWPPNKKLVGVTISGSIATFGPDIKEVTISVADEYGKYNIQGLRFGDTVMLEAWRDGNDMDGRVYTITAVVTDMAGNKTSKSATVIVPHDMGK